jgi:DNA-directed RNA polymerase omega subunit
MAMDDERHGRVDSKFRFVLVAAQRAEQLMRGARPKMEGKGKPTRTAMNEVINNLVEWDYGPAPVPEPAEATAEQPAEAEEVH